MKTRSNIFISGLHPGFFISIIKFNERSLFSIKKYQIIDIKLFKFEGKYVDIAYFKLFTFVFTISTFHRKRQKEWDGLQYSVRL